MSWVTAVEEVKNKNKMFLGRNTQLKVIFCIAMPSSAVYLKLSICKWRYPQTIILLHLQPNFFQIFNEK